MSRQARLLLLLVIGFSSLQAQYTFPYSLSKKVDYPLLSTGLLSNGISLYIDKQVKPLTEAQINALNVNNIPSFDRYSARQYSHQWHQVSNVTGFASIAFPFVLLLDKKNREHSTELVAITMEGALLTGGLINLSKTITKRARPFTYNASVPLATKMTQKARYSFMSGHTALSSYFTFTGAQMFSDLYPDSKCKPYVWAIAAILPVATAWGRIKAGKHFPSDVAMGYGVGALIGVLTPRLHRHRF